MTEPKPGCLFSDLPLDVQRQVARRWAQEAEDIADIDGEPSQGMFAHALECLATDPSTRYDNTGTEI